MIGCSGRPVAVDKRKTVMDPHPRGFGSLSSSSYNDRGRPLGV
jgi:hypothetical protein